ncbi:hypothetical protein M2271_006877 [Streptomyces sp. LBL]|nr:hypothetical protein [Streptomyces sp. LBL]
MMFVRPLRRRPPAASVPQPQPGVKVVNPRAVSESPDIHGCLGRAYLATAAS